MDITKFFSDTKGLKEIKNEGNVPDRDIFPFLNKVMFLYNLTKLVLDAHSGRVKPDLEALGLSPELLEPEDLAVACYQDDITSIDYSRLKAEAPTLYTGYYCQSNYSTQCFVDSIINLCDICNALLNTISNGDDLNFNETYKESMEQYYYDLNYCILSNFKLLSYEKGEILSCIKYYCAMTNTDVEKLATHMLSVYQEHRPNLEFLNKYPEIFDKLAEYTPTSLLFDILGMSDCIEPNEWKELLPDKNGKIARYIDQDFIDELYERNDVKRIERMTEEC